MHSVQVLYPWLKCLQRYRPSTVLLLQSIYGKNTRVSSLLTFVNGSVGQLYAMLLIQRRLRLLIFCPRLRPISFQCQVLHLLISNSHLLLIIWNLYKFPSRESSANEIEEEVESAISNFNEGQRNVFNEVVGAVVPGVSVSNLEGASSSRAPLYGHPLHLHEYSSSMPREERVRPL